MATKAELELRELLLLSGCVQPVKISSRGSSLSALCRELKGRAPAWLSIMEELLQVCEADAFPVHLCRRYVLKDGKMVFGWHIGFEARSAAELSASLAALRTLVEKREPDLGPAETVVAVTSQPGPPPPPPPAVDVGDGEVPAAPPAPTISEEERAERMKKFQQHTHAEPRASDPKQPDPPPPPFKDYYMPKVVFKGHATDQKNRIVPVEIEEMPLHGVFTTDMNPPNEKRRGAWAAGTFSPDFGKH